MLDSAEVRKALAKGTAERCKFRDLDLGLEYIRFRRASGKIERGSVITKTAFFPGFPHIKRIFTLEKGLARNIGGEYVYAEEKIDGFNLRAVRAGGEIYALTRGGIVDAFSTEKLRGIVPERAFGKNVMLCGEMIGNTPYTAPSGDFDVRYFVFDVFDLDKGKFFGQEEKYRFLERNGLESVPRLGKFHMQKDAAKLKQLALNINRARKEGIVFKSEDRAQVVKYVNPHADIEDMTNTVKQIFDMPAGHFNQRILRSAIFISEYGLGAGAYGALMGKGIYEKFAEGMRMLAKTGAIYDEFEILVKDPSIWEELKSHMGKEVRLEKISERREDGKTRMRFRKIYMRSTRKIREFLNGKGITD